MKKKEKMCKDPTVEYCGGELIPYGYSILDYARQYDRAWNEQILNLLRKLLEGTIQEKGNPVNSCDKRAKNYFPPEIVFQVMHFTDDITLIRISQTCRECYQLSLKSCLWEQLLSAKFSVKASDVMVKSDAKKRTRSSEKLFRNESESTQSICAKQLYRKMYQSYQRVVHQELYGVAQAFQSHSQFVPQSFVQGGIFTF